MQIKKPRGKEKMWELFDALLFGNIDILYTLKINAFWKAEPTWPGTVFEQITRNNIIKNCCN